MLTVKLCGMSLTAVILAALFLHPMCAIAAPAPHAATPRSDTLADVKTRLEIKKLHRELGPISTLAAWATPASLLLAIVVATGGGWRYRKDARELRSQAANQRVLEFRRDLLNYPALGPERNPTLVAALAGLKSQTPRTSDAKAERANTSTLLVELALRSVDWSNIDQASFDAIAESGWTDWDAMWHAREMENRAVLSRQLAALSKIRLGHQAALKKIDASSGTLSFPAGLPTNIGRHVEIILTAYRARTRLLVSGGSATEIDAAVVLLGSPSLTTAWFVVR
jgi:hypothetical protein